MTPAVPMLRRPARPRYKPLGTRRGSKAKRPDALHPSWCDCRTCSKPAEGRRPPRGCSLSFLVLVTLAVSTSIVFIADAIAGGPGLQVMVGLPGNDQ